MNISLGIIAYNEDKNIVNLLNSIDKQEFGDFSIKEIILVLGGCTDDTYLKARGYNGKYKEKLIIISSSIRRGKYHDINIFLKKASYSTLILSSADIILHRSAIKNILRPFNDIKVGIVSSKITPSNKGDDILSKIIRLQWDIHDKVSLKEPKFGEMIAFRNVVKKIEPTSTDEELIAREALNQGYTSFYARNAIVYNKGPKRLNEFIRQRRRIYCGHLELKKKYGYSASSLKIKNLMPALGSIIKEHPFCIVFFGAALESYSRFLGLADFIINKKKHHIWKIAESTK